MDALLGGGTILLAILGFAFVIFIHELGHFAFAKWAGVRVDVFSIGMGPIIWSKTIGETRYALSLLPIGGYVRMLGQEDLPGEQEDSSQDPASYQSKHPAWRAAILFGGVLFNLISSWLILVALGFYGMPHFPPVVGSIHPSIPTEVDGVTSMVPSPAVELGLQRGDRIISVNGEHIWDYEDVVFATLSAGTDPVVLEIERNGERMRLPAEGDGVAPVYHAGQGRVALGIDIRRSRLIANTQTIGDQPPLEVNERIDRVGEVDVSGLSGQELERLLATHAGKPVALALSGGSQGPRSVSITYAGGYFDQTSIYGLPVRLARVLPESAAADAGLRAGDVLLAIDGQPLAGQTALQSQVASAGHTALTLDVGRWDGHTWALSQRRLTPRWDAINQRPLIGIEMEAQLAGPLPPLLPPALGSTSSPLAEAGLEPGTVLLGASMRGQDLLLQTLPAGTAVEQVPLSDAAWKPLDHFVTVGLLSQLVGMRNVDAASLRMLGARIHDTGPGGSGAPEPGWITLATFTADGPGMETTAIDLRGLPEGDRSAILGLAPGSWIVDTRSRTANGQRSLLVATPAEGVAPTTSRVQPAAVGTMIAFGIEEPPIELEHWGQAFTLANHKTGQMIGKTLSLIPRFFKPGSEGGLDAEKSLHGPIGIFSELKARLQYLGFASFLKIVALIGLNLFLVNLLPIPITDGGQLVLLGTEVAIRRPLPVAMVNIINYLGLVLIVCLMLLVIGLDVARKLFG